MLPAAADSARAVCSGKLSEPRIQHPSHFVGLLLRGASLPWPNYGHVVLAKPSPILFYPISSEEASLHITKPSQADMLLMAIQVVARAVHCWYLFVRSLPQQPGRVQPG